jgi:CDGSH-type Zn-finger protein
MDAGEPRIEVLPGGPYRVSGAGLVRMRRVVGEDGVKRWERRPELPHGDVFDLCRCGRSATKPFCDGSEVGSGFDGTERAQPAPPPERRMRMGDGPVVLTDDPRLCSHATMCMAARTDVWILAEHTTDPEQRALLTSMVERCPSGRLAYLLPPDPDPVEEPLAPEVAVLDDGPLWIRGGIPVRGAEGVRYEPRNRATLCRCGGSRMKPYCDGTHTRIGFRDPADEDGA